MKRILIATLFGLSALTVGCSGTTGGPKPAPTDGASTPTSDSNASSSLKSIKPCDLISDSEAVSFGFKLPGETGKIGSAETCDWTIPGNGGLQAGVRTDKGVKDLNLEGGKLTEIKIGKFAASKLEASDGAKATCDIVISVSETSSITVVSSLNASSTDTAASCERATKAADLIAQKLP